MTVKLETLKRRPDFLRLRGGGRASNVAFVLESRPRGENLTQVLGPRFGFTVTKQLGVAVTRNRIRRRLKAAVSATADGSAEAERDYVIIARSGSEVIDFQELCKLLEVAFERVHRPAKGPPAVQNRKT